MNKEPNKQESRRKAFEKEALSYIQSVRDFFKRNYHDEFESLQKQLSVPTQSTSVPAYLSSGSNTAPTRFSNLIRLIDNRLHELGAIHEELLRLRQQDAHNAYEQDIQQLIQDVFFENTMLTALDALSEQVYDSIKPKETTDQSRSAIMSHPLTHIKQTKKVATELDSLSKNIPEIKKKISEKGDQKYFSFLKESYDLFLSYAEPHTYSGNA